MTLDTGSRAVTLSRGQSRAPLQRHASACADAGRPHLLDLGDLPDLIDDDRVHLAGLGIVDTRETDCHSGPAAHDADLERLQNGHTPHGVTGGGLDVLRRMSRLEHGHRENRSVRGHAPSVEPLGHATVAAHPSDVGTSPRHIIAPQGEESGWRDLNPRPPAPKAGALPNCAIPRYVVTHCSRATTNAVNVLCAGTKMQFT